MNISRAFPIQIAELCFGTPLCPACGWREPVRAFNNTASAGWRERCLAPDAKVFTDGLWAFRRFADAGHRHTELDTRGGRAAAEVRGTRWVNVLLGNVKCAIRGRYHLIRQARYARHYLAEAAYRFKCCFRLRELLPPLRRA